MERKYGSEEVREYLSICTSAAGYLEIFQTGAQNPRTIESGKKIIEKVRAIPEELRDDHLNKIIKGIENIVQGRPFNVDYDISDQFYNVNTQ